MKSIPSPTLSALPLDRFLSLMDQYESFVTRSGKKVRRAPPEKTKAIFLSADQALKDRMIARLESEITIFQETLEAREALDNSGRQLWRYLLKSKLVPCSDILDKISGTDTIQVYGSDMRLLFASLNFLDYVSFTLEQIFAETWQTLVVRDAKILQQLSFDFTRMLSGEIRQTMEPSAPSHLIEEVETELLLKSDLHVKWMSPVFANDRVVCIISICGITNH